MCLEFCSQLFIEAVSHKDQRNDLIYNAKPVSFPIQKSQ